jgi:hypothetical protein
MGQNAGWFKTLIAGGVLIGVVTAATLPGRKTTDVVAASGKAASGFLGTAINGK